MVTQPTHGQRENEIHFQSKGAQRRAGGVASPGAKALCERRRISDSPSPSCRTWKSMLCNYMGLSYSFSLHEACTQTRSRRRGIELSLQPLRRRCAQHKTGYGYLSNAPNITLTPDSTVRGRMNSPYHPRLTVLYTNRVRKSRVNFGASGRNRTPDPLLTRQPLYQLSYTSKAWVNHRPSE